jgi:hypothetical protein
MGVRTLEYCGDHGQAMSDLLLYASLYRGGYPTGPYDYQLILALPRESQPQILNASTVTIHLSTTEES